MPPSINNFSIAGDITFNTGQTFNIGSTYDLFTVAVHEFGHALGLIHSTIFSADMYSNYTSTKSGLASDDIAGIRNIYSNNNPRSHDGYGGNNNSFSNAADVSSLINTSNDTALVANMDVTTAGQKDYFKVVAPAGTGNTVTISLQSSGLSLLAPTLTIYAANQTTVLGMASGAGQYGTTLTVNLNYTVSAGQVIYIKVGGADNTAFGTGAYALTMSFAGAPLPSVPLPNTQVLNGSPLSGGGGIGNAVSYEMQVNSYTNGTQQIAPQNNGVAIGGNGNYVNTWSSFGQDGSGWGVFAQRFDAKGNPLGAEFQVNTTTAGDQVNPSVAMDRAGDFVIVWSSQSQPGASWEVFGQRFDSKGNAMGSEFQVSTNTKSDQKDANIAMDGAGDFVVTWAGYNPDATSQGIFARLYNATGAALGTPFQVNTTPGYQEGATVAMNSRGSFVVTWSSYGQDGSGWGVFAQLYAPGGTTIGGEFQVNTYIVGDQMYPWAAIDTAGDFVITWSSNGEDGSGWGVFAQRYYASGSPNGPEFQVNTTTVGNQMYSKVAMNPDGDMFFTWDSDSGGQDGNKVTLSSSNVNLLNMDGTISTAPLDSGNLLGSVAAPLSSTKALVAGKDTGASGWDVYAQQVSGDDGSFVGDEFRVNTTTAGNQQFSSVAMDAHGDIVTTWTSADTLAHENVMSQLFAIGGDSMQGLPSGANDSSDGADWTEATCTGARLSDQFETIREVFSLVDPDHEVGTTAQAITSTESDHDLDLSSRALAGLLRDSDLPTRDACFADHVWMGVATARPETAGTEDGILAAGPSVMAASLGDE
jgi:hypothetical protein